MHLLLILILGVFKPTALMVQNQSPKKDSESFELHGDRLGESLTTFVSKHPKAECKDSTKTRTNCYQWTDVSIFGMLAHPHPGCSLKTYSSNGCVQGLSAQFVNHRLILLSYAVAGTDKAEPTAALKKSFGSPDFDTSKATIWLHGGSLASVVVGKSTEESDGLMLITFVISSD